MLSQFGLILHDLFSELGAATGCVAAVLWFHAAWIRVPTDNKSGYGMLVGVEEMSAAFRKQGFWNAAAAVTTGAAVLLQAVATWA
jgi:hypothetical protein